jgi:hypothetical protein
MIGANYDLGNAIISGGTYQFNLKVIPEQCVVQWLNMLITATVVASEASYSFQNSAPNLVAETDDDVDLVLSAIISSLDIIVGPSFSCCSAMSIPRLRTALAYMTGQDFKAPKNGTAIVNSAGTAVTFNILIPLGLPYLFADLSVLNQGANRFASAGQININYGALNGSSQFTGTFADGSHTFTIASSSVSIRLSARLKQVAFGPGLVGALWQLTFGSGAVTTGSTKPGIHLGLFDQTGQPENVGNGYSASAYNIINGTTQLASNNSPTQLITNFQGDRVQQFAVDMTARGTPMLWYPQADTLSDFDQTGQAINYQVTETGSTTLSLLELVAIPPSAADLTDVANRVAKGGQVAVDRGVAKSMMGKRPSSPAVTPLLPVLIYPAGQAPSGLPTMSPASVGQYISDAIGNSISSAKAAQPYGKTGHQLVSRRR